MTNGSTYNLEGRTYDFAVACRDLSRLLIKNIANFEYSKQLIRSSGSVAANYIEANESLSKKDFLHKIKICLKEAKESRLWLKLFYADFNSEGQRNILINEATELIKIFAAIVSRCNVARV